MSVSLAYKRRAELYDKLENQGQAALDAAGGYEQLPKDKQEEVDRQLTDSLQIVEEIEELEKRDAEVHRLEAMVERAKRGGVDADDPENEGLPGVVLKGPDEWWLREKTPRLPDCAWTREYYDAWADCMARGRSMPREFKAALDESDVAPMIPESWNREIVSTLELENVIRNPEFGARIVPMDAVGKERLSLHTSDPVPEKVLPGINLPESEPGVVAVVLDPMKFGVWIVVNNEAWADAFGLSSVIPFSTGRAMGNLEEQWMWLDGDGATEPQAITGNVGTAFETSTANAILYADLVHFYHGSDAAAPAGGYFGDAYAETSDSGWWMNRGMVGAVRVLVDDNNQPIFRLGSLVEGTPATLMGSPIRYVKSLPRKVAAAGGTAGAMFYGSVRRGYAIGDRLSSTMQRFDEVLARSDQTAFKAVRRVDGKVTLQEAIGQFDVLSE